MKILELFWRTYIQHGIEGKMADYHLDRVKKYKGDESKWKRHGSKFLKWSQKWAKTQDRIEELKNLY